MALLHLKITDTIRAFLREFHCEPNHPTVLRDQLAPYMEDSMIPFNLLLDCYNTLSSYSEDLAMTFEQLTKGSCVVFPPKPKKPKSPELQRILEEIRVQKEAEEYENMTGRRLAFTDDPATMYSGKDSGEVRRASLGIINVFYTTISVFVAVYWVGSTISDDVALQILAALSCALIVLVAEAWLAFRAGHRRKME